MPGLAGPGAGMADAIGHQPRKGEVANTRRAADCQAAAARTTIRVPRGHATAHYGR